MRPCQRCTKSCSTGFLLGETTICIRCAVSDRRLLTRALGTSLVVGTILLTINQGDAIATGAWPPALVWKVPLTYAVPFVVCMWGALTTSRRRF